jgi:signal transduction histidine kinase
MAQQPLDTNRFLHLTIIFLLVFSLAQVVWWFIDQRSLASASALQTKTLYGYEMLAAQKLAEGGASEGDIKAIFPHARMENGQVILAPEALADLESAERRHTNRYAWEGGFFLMVQALAIAVLWRGLRGEAEIRRRQDNFLTMVSHQFKTPLASLQLSLETMVMRQLSPERFQQLSQRMLDDLRRMENMVSKILDTARLDRGRLQLNRERLFLAEAVRHVTSHLEDTAKRENIRVDVAVPADLEIHADPMAVDGVLRNLIENAMAAMGPAKGGTLTINARRGAGGIELDVRDTGVGFAPDQAEKLFDKFFRLETSGGRDAAGTGLGLFIVRRFMHFENGQVRAASEGPGKGATFTVTWPAGTVSEARAA